MTRWATRTTPRRTRALGATSALLATVGMVVAGNWNEPVRPALGPAAGSLVDVSTPSTSGAGGAVHDRAKGGASAVATPPGGGGGAGGASDTYISGSLISVPPIGGGGGDGGGSSGGGDNPEQPGSAYATSWAANKPFGQYRVTALARADSATRLDLTVTNQMAGSFYIDPTWRTVTALVHVDGPSTVLGARAAKAFQMTNISVESIGSAFTVRGTKILSPSGNVWTLRATNRPGYEFYADGSPAFNKPMHESNFMVDWGMNGVRIPLNQEFWLENCAADYSFVHESYTKPDGTKYRYREMIREEVEKYRARGMYVVLDLHITSYGKDLGCTTDNNYQASMPDNRSLIFWEQVAEAYKSEPWVGFDLFNEPQFVHVPDPPSPSQQDVIWRDGGTLKYKDGWLTKSYTAVGMQHIYNIVRNKVGATNLIFVAGLNYAADAGVFLRKPLSATGLVIDEHFYCWDCPPPWPTDWQKRVLFGELAGEPNVLGPAERFPVASLEFGDDEYWSGQKNQAFIDYITSKGFGWAVYSWTAGGDGSNGGGQTPFGILKYSPQWATTREPGPAGMPIWNALAPYR